MTLTFLRLGRVAPWDAAFYVGAQFAGSVAGLMVVVVIAGGLVAAPSVNYVATIPGPRGMSVAFAAELAIAFLTMTMVLVTTARLPRFAPFTGLIAGTLVAIYITLEAPLSGMSLNPARSFASALLAQLWTGFWIYPPRRSSACCSRPSSTSAHRHPRCQAPPRQRPAMHLPLPVRP